MLIKDANYNMLILGELQRLEDLSSEYKAILILISKRIRRDLWQCGKNDVMLYKRERWGDFSYNLPIPSNGDYILILKFADTCLNEIGTRIFDVEIGREKY